MPRRGRNCGDCDAWESQDKKNGACHLMPQTGGRINEDTIFPPISFDAWCCQHTPIPEPVSITRGRGK